MQLQVNLVRSSASSNPDDTFYKVHTQIGTEYTGYVGVIEDTLDYILEAETAVIKFKIKKDPDSIVKMPYSNPIVFTRSLAEIPLGSNYPYVRVEFYEVLQDGQSKELKKKKVVHIGTADEDGMPI